MKKTIISIAVALLSIAASAETLNCHDIAVRVYQKGLTFPDNYMMGTYRGSCLLHAMAELAVITGDKQDLALTKDLIWKTEKGEIKYKGNFESYLNGGSATSLLYFKGNKDLKEIAEKGAAHAFKTQARTFDGMISAVWAKKRPNQMFIDVLFCTTPFFLYEGLAEKNQEYIDFSAWEAVTALNMLYDPESGLFHQGRGWPDPNTLNISEDCWSRGNGWGSMALHDLIRDLPKSNKHYAEVRKIAKRFYENCIKFQDPETGLWHQEMTDPSSFTEISGSGLILCGIGQAIQSGVISKKYMENFKKGLKGLMAYVDPDGSVGSTCMGCLCPGKATKDDYRARRFYYNEAHAFGPVVFALSQAISLGIKEFDATLGTANDGFRPRTYVKFVSERKEDIAWENDVAAYRVYSRLIPNDNASGIDYWGKSRDYSVIDKWYKMNNEGQNYHVDRGEGADFYLVGVNPNRGVGGTGVYVDGTLYAAKDYASYRIFRNDSDRIDFALYYQPYEAAGKMIYETKRIEMVMGTPFFKVTATFETSDGSDVVMGAGLTVNTEKAKVNVDKANGFVSVSEAAVNDVPRFYTGIVTNPSNIKDIVKNGPDRLVLMNVKSGSSVVYYAGASNELQYLCRGGNWNGFLQGKPYTKLQNLYK